MTYHPEPLTAERLEAHITALGFQWSDFVWLYDHGLFRPSDIRRGLAKADGTHPNIRTAKRWVEIWRNK